MRLIRKICQFLEETSAFGALEFALIAPFMVALWLGTIELTELHLANRKVTVAVQTVADLTAQEQTLTIAKLEDIVSAVNAIMAPYPTGGMGYDIVSVEADIDGNVSAGWRFTRGNISPGGAIPPRALTLVTQNESVIAATITYRYQTAFSLLIADVDIIEEAYVRPRRVLAIPLS